MIVLSLLHTPPGSDSRVTELILGSVRVGFPTSDLVFYDNNTATTASSPNYRKLGSACFPTGGGQTHHHWIRECLRHWQHYDKPIVFVDGDVHFWESMEDFQPNGLLSGCHIPSHRSPISGLFHIERLHTSLLWIRSARELWLRMNEAQEAIPSQCIPYLNLDWVSPHLSCIEGHPIYFDTCAEMYHAIGGEHFNDGILSCYTHVGSASCYEAVRSMLPDDEAQSFQAIHALAAHDIESLRTLYKEHRHHYASHAMTLDELLHPRSA